MVHIDRWNPQTPATKRYLKPAETCYSELPKPKPGTCIHPQPRVTWNPYTPTTKRYLEPRVTWSLEKPETKRYLFLKKKTSTPKYLEPEETWNGKVSFCFVEIYPILFYLTLYILSFIKHYYSSPCIVYRVNKSLYHFFNPTQSSNPVWAHAIYSSRLIKYQ